MQYIVFVGRVCFALIFIVAAPRHFSQAGIRHAADLGVPFANLVVPLSGVMALAGGLSVLLGYQANYGAWLLAAFLVPVTLGMHRFWVQTDPVMRHTQLAMFAKNVALLGAALMLTNADIGAWRLSR